jgi:hypothetical protein
MKIAATALIDSLPSIRLVPSRAIATTNGSNEQMFGAK